MLDRLDKKIRWFDEAKLGMFIHWGLYSATEGFYKDKETKGIVEWIQLREEIPNSEYEKYADNLSADKFDAKRIAELAEYAGAKYMVFTSKHHDGFSMFDTSVDDYSINKRCRVKRDVLKELTDEMRSRNIVPCIYYSQGVDFHEENAMGNTWDFKTPEEERNFEEYFNGKCKLQLKELLTRYGDIGIMWFDVPWGITPQRAKNLKEYVKELQPNCLVNGRLGGDADDSDFLCMGDNEAPYGRVSVCAEVCATTNDSWGFKRNDKNYKDPKTIIELLCSVVSKGANLLLNIGPKPNGELPEQAVDIFTILGDWMKVNSEAIYKTTASPFMSDFSFGWVTQKDNNLYLMVNNPKQVISIFGLNNKIIQAQTLSGEDVKVLDNGEEKTLYTDNIAWRDDVTVIKVRLDSPPSVRQTLFQQERDQIYFPCSACQIIKDNDKLEVPTFNSAMDRVLGEYWGNLSQEMKVNINGSIEWWKSEKNYVFWEVDIKEIGLYEAVLFTATGKYMPWQGKHQVRIEMGGNSIQATLCEDEIISGVNRKYFSETGSRIGELKVDRCGKHIVNLYADKINPDDIAGLYVTRLILRKKA